MKLKMQNMEKLKRQKIIKPNEKFVKKKKQKGKV